MRNGFVCDRRRFGFELLGTLPCWHRFGNGLLRANPLRCYLFRGRCKSDLIDLRPIAFSLLFFRLIYCYCLTQWCNGERCNLLFKTRQCAAGVGHASQLQLLDPDVQAVAALFECLHGCYGGLYAVGGNPLKQCFHGVTQVAQCLDPGHPGATLESVDFTLQVLHQFLVKQFVAPGVKQCVAAFQYFCCFCQEE